MKSGLPVGSGCAAEQEAGPSGGQLSLAKLSRVVLVIFQYPRIRIRNAPNSTGNFSFDFQNALYMDAGLFVRSHKASAHKANSKIWILKQSKYIKMKGPSWQSPGGRICECRSCETKRPVMRL